MRIAPPTGQTDKRTDGFEEPRAGVAGCPLPTVQVGLRGSFANLNLCARLLDLSPHRNGGDETVLLPSNPRFQSLYYAKVLPLISF